MLFDIKTHTLESIPFNLIFTSTVLEMSLLFPAVNLPPIRRVVVKMQQEYTAGEN